MKHRNGKNVCLIFLADLYFHWKWQFLHNYLLDQCQLDDKLPYTDRRDIIYQILRKNLFHLLSGKDVHLHKPHPLKWHNKYRQPFRHRLSHVALKFPETVFGYKIPYKNKFLLIHAGLHREY